jgi:hypothetical protein
MLEPTSTTGPSTFAAISASTSSRQRLGVPSAKSPGDCPHPE